MDEYIKREDMNNTLDEMCVVDGIYNALQAIPTADVVEVVHGEWFTVEYNDGSVFEECSRCGAGKPPKHNTFCSKCGAKMSNKSIYFKKQGGRNK